MKEIKRYGRVSANITYDYEEETGEQSQQRRNDEG